MEGHIGMIRLCAVIALFALAACGVDGEPEPPVVNGTVTLSSSGAGAGIVVGQGPFSLGLGL
jgi:hypothetical protein